MTSRDAIGVRFDGLTVRICCRDRGHLAWLEEFLTPWFESVPAGEGVGEVMIAADGDEYDRRVAQGPRADAAAVHCFSLDSGAVRLPLWSSESDRQIVFDQRLRAFYEVEEAARRVTVLTRPDDLSVRFAAMRIVRELAQERARSRGHLLLHAAALSIDGRSFAIAGAKGAGKTSLLVASLLGGSGRFVSNDRIVVRLGADGASVHGMPTLVSVRAPTLEAHPDLRREIERKRYDHMRVLGEAGEGRRRWQNGSSIDLSPAQFCELLGVDAAAEGRLAALLFVRSYSLGGGVRLGTLGVDRTADHVARARLGSEAEDTPPSIFASLLGPAAPPTDRRDIERRLAACVPGFELRTESLAAGGVEACDLLRAWSQ
jgi:hypothetical protein